MKPADLLNDLAYVALLGTISDSSVAARYNISRNTVLDHRTRLGIKPARNHAPISDQARSKMDKMLREGTWTYAQIAQGCHVHVTTVQLRARDLGIDRTEKARQVFRMIARRGGARDVAPHSEQPRRGQRGEEQEEGGMNLDPLLHMLGLNEDQRWPTRNHYVTSANDPAIVPLIAAGLVEETRAPGFLAADDHVFRATLEGNRVAVAENERRNPKPSRSRARYLKWLDVADVYWPMKFGEWLRRGLYRDRA